MYIERLRTWHRIVLQLITQLRVYACINHVYLLSEDVSSDCETNLFQEVMAS